MRISDWSSDVCSSDLPELDLPVALLRGAGDLDVVVRTLDGAGRLQEHDRLLRDRGTGLRGVVGVVQADTDDLADAADAGADARVAVDLGQARRVDALQLVETRSEEHTSELQSLMRISYAVFCLKKKKPHLHSTTLH